MKIVIDIPDSDYQSIKECYEKNDIVEATYSYIYYGTPLEEHCDSCVFYHEESEEQYEDSN